MNIFTKSLLSLAAVAVCTPAAFAGQFTTDGLQYSTLTDSTVCVKKYISGTDVVIPDSVADDEANKYEVVSIAAQAFRMANVNSVTVPPTVKTIEVFAFNRSKVKKVVLAEGVETLGYGTFAECSMLTDVNIPRSVKELGAVYPLIGMGGSVFSGCQSLEKIEIPETIKEIPQLTFATCYGLSEVILHDGLETIGERAFEECSNLFELNVPSSVTTIEHGAFNKAALVHPVVSWNVKVIPNSCFLWCYNIQSFDIKPGVEEIGKQAFADCGNFTEVRVPNTVEWIRSDAFQGNANVTTIYLGEGLRRLGNSSLAVWAPNEATNVPRWSLKDIYIAAPVPPYHEQNDDHIHVLADDFFFGGSEFTEELREQFYSEVTLHVPAESLEAYRNDAIWGNFKNIVGGYSAIGNITTDGNQDITFDNNVVTSKTAGIEVYNAAGASVAKTAGTTLNLEQLPAGIYVIRSGKTAIKAAVR
ncbi:MAG: leucine-rich repeat domain-containing protein [Bacteroides sp.]|nr:leucine-rich repeat domain-containing protein [Bacteroides sp.]MCM1476308.1 leucine-rich repeat domain-containing protein [Bacteroides sp.]